jgi:hypothetical protein
MQTNHEDVFMNGMTKDRKGFPLFIIDHGVHIGENGVGSGDGWIKLEASFSEVVVDRELGKDDLDILQVEIET